MRLKGDTPPHFMLHCPQWSTEEEIGGNKMDNTKGLGRTLQTNINIKNYPEVRRKKKKKTNTKT